MNDTSTASGKGQGQGQRLGFGADAAWTWRRLRRALVAGELRLLMLALVLAVASCAAVVALSQRIEGGLDQQSGDALGGALALDSHQPVAAAFRARIAATGARQAEMMSFPSMARSRAGADARTALVSLKAVGGAWPLRGAPIVAYSRQGPGAVARLAPRPGEAWAEPALLAQLGLHLGDTLFLGRSQLRITGRVLLEPDRGVGFSSLSPRLLIAASDLPASGLLGLGSRADYRLLVDGSPEAIDATRAMAPPPEAGPRGWRTPREARPELRSALERAGRVLRVAALAATLLAAVAVALAAGQHGRTLHDEAALLRTLGLRRARVFGLLAGSLGWLVLAATLVGLALGFAVQAMAAAATARWLDLALPAVGFNPFALAFALGLLVSAGFALPPVWAAARTPPARVLSRQISAPALGALSWAVAGGVLVVLSLLLVQDAALAARVLGGLAVAAAALALVGALLVWSLGRSRGAARGPWRWGLAQVARRKNASVGQIVSLGLSLTALLLLAVVQHDLLSRWQAQLPPGTPNHFVINIQPEQRAALPAWFAAHNLGHPPLAAMVRGRLVARNGVPVTAATYTDEDAQRLANRELNLTSVETFGADNTLVAGHFWGRDGRGKPWLSIEEGAAKQLRVGLGDTLTINFAGEPLTLTVVNLRKTHWDSFQPNFFLAVPPGVLDDAPTQYLASFYAPSGGGTWLPALSSAFPNLTVIDLEAALGQVRSLIDRLTRLLSLVLGVTLAAGLLVVAASLEASRATRVREAALMRALGARAADVRRAVLIEMGVLGALAGFAAALAAQSIAWALAGLLDLPFSINPWLWAVGLVAGAGLMLFFGAFSMLRVARAPPASVLAGT